MSEYYWNSTDCIWSDNLEDIELALTRILEQEGCHRIYRLPQPPLDIKEDRWYKVRDLWIIGLFPGAIGWTVVKTSPTELLCRQAKGATHSWLSELAMQIGRDAFHISVYASYAGVLMEVDARGRTFIFSETTEYGPMNGKFHEQQINDQENSLQFFLLQVPEEMQVATRVNTAREGWERKYEQLKVLREEQNERAADIQSGIEELEKLSKLDDEIEELLRGDFQIVDEALGQLLSGSHSRWYLRENLVYLAYTQQQQLEAQGARLLYFQPAENYIQPEVETAAEPAIRGDIPF